jgi:hypothetical protein
MFQNNDVASLDALIRQVIPRELHVAGFAAAAGLLAGLPPFSTRAHAAAGSAEIFDVLNALVSAIVSDPARREKINTLCFAHLGSLVSMVTVLLGRMGERKETPS